MNRKPYINKSNYNNGKFDIDHFLPYAKLLGDLETSKDHLKKIWSNLIYIDSASNSVITPSSCKLHTTISGHHFSSEHFNSVCNALEVSKLDNALSRHILVSDRLNEITAYHDSGKNRQNISELNEKLRCLRNQLKFSNSSHICLEIKKLVHELHSYVILNLKFFRRGLKKIRKTLICKVKRDIRNFFRRIMTFTFKNLCDLSGCEEDLFTISNGSKYFFLHSQSVTCLVQKNLFQKLIHL